MKLSRKKKALGWLVGFAVAIFIFVTTMVYAMNQDLRHENSELKTEITSMKESSSAAISAELTPNQKTMQHLYQLPLQRAFTTTSLVSSTNLTKTARDSVGNINIEKGKLTDWQLNNIIDWYALLCNTADKLGSSGNDKTVAEPDAIAIIRTEVGNLIKRDEKDLVISYPTDILSQIGPATETSEKLSVIYDRIVKTR